MHGGVTRMVGVLCMISSLNVCWVEPFILSLGVPDEDSKAWLVVEGGFNLG